jgi:peptidoglycan/LPS O-acetylase OafA/YrhL
MYAFVALVGVAGLLARPRAGAAALVAAVAAIVALGPWDVAYVAERWQWVFVTSFLLGMAAYLARDRVPISLPIAALVAVAVVAVSGRPFAETAFTLALPYWVLVLAYHPTLPRVRLPGDYSYGIYVYAFPIQQAVAQAIPGLSAATMLAVSFPLVVAVAAMSWHGLEQPMLRRKPRPAAQRIVQSAFDPAAPEPTLDRP